MPARDETFRKALLETFRVEAAEHVQTIADGLLGLEKSTSGEAAARESIATIFRAAHSLKGAARAVDHADVETFCQDLEDLFADWKKQGRAPAAASHDVAHRLLDDIAAALRPAESAPPAAPPAAPVPAAIVTEPVRAPVADTVRISVGKLETRLVEAEEMLAAKLGAGQRATDLRHLAGGFETLRGEWAAVESAAMTLRRRLDRDDRADPELGRVLDFFEHGRDQFKTLETRVSALARRARLDHHDVGRRVDDLLEDSKKLLLLPFSTLTAPLPKAVRDLCRDQGKEAAVEIRGEDVELDKRILEEMKDAFLHLLRNAVDHGIEPPAERLRRGKPARATLTLSAAPLDGGKVELIVADDGAGIDTAKVKASAIRHGHLSPGEADRLDEAGARDLIFLPEVSTSTRITTLSGRGLGMAIVREKAGQLGGRVSVESEPGRGTRFRIVLPSLLATFRGIVVTAAGQDFVIPTAQVRRAARVKPAELRSVEGRATTTHEGRALSVVRLADVLGMAPAPQDGPDGDLVFLVLGSGEQSVAFVMDAVKEEHEVLVKPFRKPLVRVRHFSGATVLGDGRVAPVLHAPDLLLSARGLERSPLPAAPAPEPRTPAAKTVLVAEDSITSRMLLKGMLESAGYRVSVAADGMDAFEQLRGGQFDLLVSDIEMPRLDGFGLTARVRADRKLAELPVVLVTSLERREDRERGIDAGANAYLVKSSFDESNLLEAVRRLI